MVIRADQGSAALAKRKIARLSVAYRSIARNFCVMRTTALCWWLHGAADKYRTLEYRNKLRLLASVEIRLFVLVSNFPSSFNESLRDGLRRRLRARKANESHLYPLAARKLIA